MADMLAVPVTTSCDHEHNVFLSPSLPFAAGFAAERIILGAFGKDGDTITRLLLEALIRHGVTGWDLEDDFDVEAVLSDYRLSRPVALRIEALGWDSQVIDPLLPSRSRPSGTGPTQGTTSPRKQRTRTRSV
jgi:hypothetical protein